MRLVYSSYAEPLSLTELAKRAVFPKLNFVDEPRIGVPDVDLLPSELLLDFREESGRASAHTSVGDIVRAGELKIRGVSSETLLVESEESTNFLFEIMRVDLTGSEEQEILVHVGGKVIGGKLWDAQAVILGRFSNEDPLSVRDPGIKLKV
jgi:hypothetical protein